MKALPVSAVPSRPFTLRCSLAGLGLVIIISLPVRAAEHPVLSAAPAMPGIVRVQLGTIGVVPSSAPAVSGIDADGGLTDLKAGRKKISPEDLAQYESDVKSGLQRTAEQKFFRDAFLAESRRKTRRDLVLLESGDAATPPAIETRLELRVEEMMLRRVHAQKDFFVLDLRARVTLERTADGVVVYEQPFTYQSGGGTFVDFAMGEAATVRRLAETGFRKLAENMVHQLFTAQPDSPVMAEAGNEGKPLPLPRLATPYRPAGTISIVSSTPGFGITTQSPPARNEAIAATEKKVESAVLDNCRGASMGALLIGAVLVPTMAGVHLHHGALAVPDERLRAATKNIVPAIAKERPAQTIGASVAGTLRGRTSSPVVYREGPVSSVGPPQPAEAAITDQDRTVEIAVVFAEFKGRRGLINPDFALSLHIRLSILRTRDGRELFSCPLEYQSMERSYRNWAMNEAQPLRVELENCYEEMTRAIVRQLEQCGVISPAQERMNPANVANN